MEQEVATQVVSLGGSTDFSLIQLFLRADFIVKSVIIILIAASVYSWALIFDKFKLKTKYLLGSSTNIKVTNKDDLSVIKKLLGHSIKIGNAFDIHKISKGNISVSYTHLTLPTILLV